MKIQRITISGTPGSGKSTLAVKLGDMLHLPTYHLDQILWKENWVLRETEDYLNLLRRWIAEESWIIDGSSVKTLEMRYARSHTVIHLAPPRWRCVLRVFKRLWFKDARVQDKPSGCYEKVDLSFLKYLWRVEKKATQEIQRLHEKYPEVRLFIVKNNHQRGELIAFLREHKP